MSEETQADNGERDAERPGETAEMRRSEALRMALSACCGSAHSVSGDVALDVLRVAKRFEQYMRDGAT